MIAGIGIDLAEIARFERMLERHGDRIVQRILTVAEREQFEKRHRSATFLASRFAAKEAVSKAFGSGIAQGIGFHSIEIINDDAGKPLLRFYGAARELAARRSIRQSLLSLSDERHYAVAMVVLETG